MKYKLLLVLSIFGFFSSCSQEEENLTPNQAREVDFAIEKNQFSRAGKDAFELGDSIGIFAVKRSNSSSQAFPGASGNQAHNAKWVKTEDGWRPATVFDKVLWATDGSAMDFYAYYPFDRSITNPVEIKMGVALSQAEKSSFFASDKLRAVNAEGLAEGKVTLLFDHVFSMVQVKMYSDQVLDNTIKVTVDGIYSSLTYNIGTGQQTLTDKFPVQMYCVNPEQNLYQAVIPSQNIAEGTIFLTCDYKGNTYQYVSTGVNLERGTCQKFEINMKN